MKTALELHFKCKCELGIDLNNSRSQSHRVIRWFASSNHQNQGLLNFGAGETTAESSHLESQPGNSEYLKAKLFTAIPGPKQLPIFGNLLDYKLGSFSPKTYHLALIERFKKYGPLVKENFAGRQLVHIFDPDDAKIVFQNEGKTPYVMPLQETALIYRSMRQLSLGLGNMNGEEWYKLKKNVQQAMLRPQSVYAYIPLMEEVANDFVNFLKKKRSFHNKIQDFKTQVAKWSIESSGMLVFEKRLKAFEDELFIEKIIKANEIMFYLSGILKFSLPIYKYVTTPKWKKLVAAEDYFYDEVNKLINEAFEKLKLLGDSGDDMGPEKFSFIGYLLNRPELTPKDVYIICLSLFGDGLNTTAPALIYNLYCLAANSTIQEKLHSEIKSVISKSDKLSSDLLQSLPYLKACVKECFRLYPIGSEISRIVQKNLVLHDYQIPAGTHVEINMGPQLKSEAYFQKPLQFWPERWLRESKDETIHPFVLTPFGHGPRMCAGRRFAEQDLYVALIKLVSNFHITHIGPPVEQEMQTLLLPTNTDNFIFVDRL